MKKTFSTYLPILLALILLGAVSVYATGVWNDPTAAAPSTGIAAPVHVGNDQVKQVGTGTSNAGGLSVNSFISGGSAYFDQQSFFQGVVYGGTPTTPSGAVTFGGSANTVNLTSSGNVSTATFIQSQAVANPTNKMLCSTTAGVIVVCP